MSLLLNPFINNSVGTYLMIIANIKRHSTMWGALPLWCAWSSLSITDQLIWPTLVCCVQFDWWHCTSLKFWFQTKLLLVPCWFPLSWAIKTLWNTSTPFANLKHGSDSPSWLQSFLTLNFWCILRVGLNAYPLGGPLMVNPIRNYFMVQDFTSQLWEESLQYLTSCFNSMLV